MTSSAKTIKSVCELLQQGRHQNAAEVIRAEYPFSFVKPAKRAYTRRESMAVFIKDGFTDRYSGAHLVFPGTLRLIHKLLPTEFPFHTNWRMSDTHLAFWELFPTVDHVIPVARGGSDSFDNLVTTSQLRNSAKSNWLLAELDWQLRPAGSISDWDGLTCWFLDLLTSCPEHLTDPYVNAWYKAAIAHPLPNLSFTPKPPTGDRAG